MIFFKSGAKDSPSPPWIASYPAYVRWDAPVETMPVSDLLDLARARFGNRPGFSSMGRTWLWSELAGLSERFAQGLQSQGVGKGDRVALFLPNSHYYLVAYFALARIGAIIVNLNPLYAPREIAHLVEDSGVKLAITADLKILYDKMHEMLHDTGLERLVICKFADALPFPKNIAFPIARSRDMAQIAHPERMLWFDDLIRNEGRPTPVRINPEEDIAVFQYTGGTTGTPKAAMLTHANVTANAAQCALWFPDAVAGQEKILGVIPFFHVFAMTAVMNLGVRLGLEIIALPKFEIEETLRLIHKKKPHYFPAVPAIYNAINHHPHRKRYDLSSLKLCISGGAPLSGEIRTRFERETGCVLVEGYGLTEAAPVVCVNPPRARTGSPSQDTNPTHEQDDKVGLIGLPLPRTTVEIISRKTGKPLPVGEAGELCVRGPQVMKGYWNKPEDTAQSLRNGLLHTGDVGVMDANGMIRIVDRIKDMIITNGYNVYPRIVEEAISLHPSVEECIVAGRPDRARGEIVKAWIKTRDDRNLNAEDLRAFLSEKLSPMEIPRQMEFRKTPLPKTPIGKLSRKDILAEEQAKAKTEKEEHAHSD